ncbi:DUF4040 domain-containing protein [Halomonas sp. M1]|uniref:DUF4040 domain-containing protein n=1 Tax=Halomonas sp. M1 TaxID=3035470 RepID=UPI002485229C|nr:MULTISPECIES: DUF4040 domain-containing protein [unclassified Halomonas]MDP3535532.1 DUF4040 domain-containing protein [Halomonas sp.]WFE72751.1 DUF4040 domain-containing protein [Halomonas sp. M1]
MIASSILLEGGLALCLCVVALACLFDRHLLRASCLFVVFALLMTLAWWWLGAPWLALAELVLGALLTGASFFYALRMFPSDAETSTRGRRVTYYDNLRGSWHHGLARAFLALAWCLMMGGAIRYVMPEMAYSPTEHPLVLAAVFIAATAMGAFALHRHLLRRLLAFNILGSGVFLLLAGMAGTVEGAQALVSVGLAIAWLGSLLGALLIRHLLLLEGEDALGHDGKAKEHTQ